MSSATWNPQPTSNDWDTAGNWSNNEIPTDTARFSSTSQTQISFSQVAGSSIGQIAFDSEAPTYSFNFTAASPSAPTLLLTGSGVANDSGLPQSFVVAASSAGYQNPQLKFANSASAGGSNNYYVAGPASPQDAGGGVIRFVNQASAGNANFMAWTGAGTPPESGSTVGGEISFGDSATAATASFTIYGSLGSDGDTFGNAVFHDQASAANATFTNVGGTVSGGDGGNTQFYDNANAASAYFYNQGGSCAQANGGDVAFDGSASAGNAHFYNYAAPAAGAYGGVTSFNNNPPTTSSGGASAGSGHFFNFGARNGALGGGGHVEFTAKYGSATAATGCFNNYGSDIAGNASAGHSIFSISGSSPYCPSAGNAVFYNHPAVAAGGAAGFTEFAVYTNNSAGTGAAASSAGPTAANATLYNLGAYLAGAAGGYTSFSGSSQAGSATLIAHGGTQGGYGGKIVFYDQSAGATASVSLDGNGELDLSDHDGPLTLANLVLNGGILRLQLSGTTTTLNLSGSLLLNGGCSFDFTDTSVTAGTPYTLLNAPNLALYAASQFAGNPVAGLQPSFSLNGTELQVTFA